MRATSALECITAFLIPLSLALVSCASPIGPTTTSAWVYRDLASPTPTLAPYWDLLPLQSQPKGGWGTYQIGGVPAFRDVLPVGPAPSAPEYIKVAFVGAGGKLYGFQYDHRDPLGNCDAPPLSEESVYEHLLATVEFDR